MKKWMSMFMAVAFVATLLLMPKPAEACSCMMPPGPAEEMERQEVVFSGEVTEIAEPEVIESSGDPVTITFDIDTVWKGEIGAQAEVQTAYSSATCGYYFELGQSYLVYGSTNEDGQTWVNLCSRTATLDRATEDLSILGEGVRPGDDGGETEGPIEIMPVIDPPPLQPVASASGGIQIVVSGQPLQLDVSPLLHHGITYVPVRAAESLAGVRIESWDGETKSVTIRHESGAVITLRAGGSTVQQQSLAAGEPIIIDGRVMVPVRFMAESFGWTVSWDHATKTIRLDQPAS